MPQKMNRPFSATTDKDFGENYINISRNERGLIGVRTKSDRSGWTYSFLNFFIRGVDDEPCLDQPFTLTSSEIHRFTNIKKSIGMQPGPKKEVVTPTSKAR